MPKQKKYKLPLEMFYHWEKTIPNNIYFRQPIEGIQQIYNWAYVGDQVRRMASYLKSLNLPENSNIGIFSKNCAHWIMADLAIWMSGNVSVPLYPNLGTETINHVLTHSEAKVLFVGKLDGWKEMKPGVPKGLPCIGFPYGTTPEFETWNDIVAKNEPMQESPIRSKDEVATIIYTSGTTGKPKGVVHKFHSFSYAMTNYLSILKIDTTDSFFSYLPLSHVAERLLAETGSLYSGGKVSFAESLDTFAENLKEASPTVFLGVPRIWTKFQLGILGKLPQHKLDKLLGIPVVNKLIKKKLHGALGLGRVRYTATGAAPMPDSLLTWYATLGFEILEAYSMTENFAYSHLTYPGKRKVGCVGQPLPNVEYKITEEGELLVKNEALMEGYYKQPKETKEAFIDGFLRTGDMGEVDRAGYLKITGRVKDLFKTSKGKYVVPSPIEKRFAESSSIEQICVGGVSLAQPIALVVLSEMGQAKSKAELTTEFQALLKKINPELDSHERLHRLVVVKEPWSVENDILTPTMKIKRNVIENTYKDKMNAWYEDKATVVFEA
ncbi:AMP-binding protein [Deltaproteobacteria bacterium TL4]